MKKHNWLIILIGTVWTVLVLMLYFHEFIHGVLHFEILPANPLTRYLIVIVCGVVLTIVILINKGYISLQLNFDEPKKIKSKFSAIDDIMIAEKNGQFERVINLGTSICRTLYIEGYHKLRYEVGKAIQSAAVRTKNRKIEMEAYIDYIGWSLVLMKQFDNSKAIDYINHGILLAKSEPKESFWLAKATRHIGAIKLIEHNYSEAESIFNDALKYAEEISEEKLKNEMIAGIYFDIALIKLILNDTSTAKQICSESRKIREHVGDKTRICRMFALEGKIYEAENDRINAKNSFTEGLDYAKNQNRKDEIIRNHIGLARVLKDDDITKAKEHFEEAKKLINDSDAPFDIYGEEKIPFL